MKCNYPGCFAFLLPEDALYPELAVMEKTLGRKVVEEDIDNFALHCTHGIGSSRSAAIHFFHTAYQGKPLLAPTKAQKTPAPASKPSKEVVEARALAIRFRFSLSVEGALEAAKRHRTNGKSLEREMSTQRMLEGKKRKLAAKRAAAIEARSSEPTGSAVPMIVLTSMRDYLPQTNSGSAT
jgi:hypothetical protein